MKYYPKKYYAKAASSESIATPSDVFAVGNIFSNYITLDVVHQVLVTQIYLGYLYPQVYAHLLFFAYDMLYGLQSDPSQSSPTRSLSISEAVQSFTDLGLCQSRTSPILATDLSSRHHIKNLSAILHRSGALVAQKVVYFWDFVSGMSVSDQDIAWVPRPKDLHRIRCFIDSKKDSILLHMSDPHLLFGVVAIAVDPEDRRYRKLVGKKVIIPIINRIVPIVADAAVSAMTFNGIKPVVPCHDRMSLAIAQRHNLPCDVFSVDAYGVFTDQAAIYAGKPYHEFSSNIIQYLQDIHNYDGAESVVIDVPFCKKIQRYVGCFLADGWVIVPDMFQTRLVDLVNSDGFMCDQNDKNHIIESLQSIDPLIVSSSHGAVGIADTPTGPGGLFAHISSLKGKWSPGSRALMMIVLDMLYDGLIPKKFVMEHCIDALFADDTLGQSYIELLRQHFTKDATMRKDIDVLSGIFSAIQEGDTKAMDSMIDMVDNASLLERDGHYYHSGDVLDAHAFLSDIFISGALSYVARERDLWTGKSRFALNTENSFLQTFIVSCIVDLALDYDLSDWMVIQYKGMTYDRMLNFDKHCIQPLSYYSSDTMRLALLNGQIADLSAHELVIQKIWNVCRYVYMDVVVSGAIDVSGTTNIFSVIQEDSNQLTPFDQWILYTFSDLMHKLQDTSNLLLSLEYRIDLMYRVIIDDFAVKYIEIVKQRKGPLSYWVMLLCVSMIRSMLAPLFPGMMQQIQDLFGPILGEVHDIQTLQIPSKNYKIHLLMLIIGALRKMKHSLLIKNHEYVDICIQGSTDIAAFVQENRSLLDAVVRIHDIQMVSLDHEIHADYLQEYVVDIALGLKVHMQDIADIDRLYILLKEKNEYLQHLRALIAVSDNPEKVLKIEKLKEEIQDLEYQIMKGKEKK